MSSSRRESSLEKEIKIDSLVPYREKFAFHDFQKRKFQFLNELTSLLYTHKNEREICNIIPDLIVYCLELPENYFLDKVFTSKKELIFQKYAINDYLIIIKKIHMLLFQISYISEKKRIQFYRLERYCMNLYLKNIKLMK